MKPGGLQGRLQKGIGNVHQLLQVKRGFVAVLGSILCVRLCSRQLMSSPGLVLLFRAVRSNELSRQSFPNLSFVQVPATAPAAWPTWITAAGTLTLARGHRGIIH